jgi:hypothetical protein
VRLLVKNVGKRLPKIVDGEELETLNIRVQVVAQIRSGRRDQDPANKCPPLPTLSYPWREGLRCPECELLPSSAVCGPQRRRAWHRKVSCNALANSASDIRNVTADTRPGEARVGIPPLW